MKHGHKYVVMPNGKIKRCTWCHGWKHIITADTIIITELTATPTQKEN